MPQTFDIYASFQRAIFSAAPPPAAFSIASLFYDEILMPAAIICRC